MSNVKNDAPNQYFSGQGVLLLETKTAAGISLGYQAVGNVTDVMIAIATSTTDHKGSQDGQRATDKRLVTETKVTMSMTMDSWNADNIARALRGSSTRVAAGSVTGESISAAPGRAARLTKLMVSAVVIAGLTEYTVAGAAWDFRVNADAGSVTFNDGRVEAPVTIDRTVTAVAVGATTQLTLTQTDFVVGQRVYLYGFTGTNASALNGKFANITARSGTTFNVDINTTALTITTGAGTRVLNLDLPLVKSVDYSFAEYMLVDALVNPTTEIAVRFEGLNTADTNKPVVIDVWKYSADPLKELALISDAFADMKVEGAVLSDASKPSGTSKYFQVRKLDS